MTPDCGNAPKRALLRDYAIALAERNLADMLAVVAEEVEWDVVGRWRTRKDGFESAVDRLLGGEVLSLTSTPSSPTETKAVSPGSWVWPTAARSGSAMSTSSPGTARPPSSRPSRRSSSTRRASDLTALLIRETAGRRPLTVVAPGGRRRPPNSRPPRPRTPPWPATTRRQDPGLTAPATSPHPRLPSATYTLAHSGDTAAGHFSRPLIRPITITSTAHPAVRHDPGHGAATRRPAGPAD
jgi:hypothetical protein